MSATGGNMIGGGGGGGLSTGGGTITGNLAITGTLDVTGVATFTTTVTGSGNIMAGAAFAVGFTGRGQWKSSADGILNPFFADGSTVGRIRFTAVGTAAAWSIGGNGGGIFFRDSGFRTAFCDAGEEIGEFSEIFGLTITTSGGTGRGVHWTTGALGGSHVAGTYLVGTGILGFCGASITGAGGIQPAQSANGATLQINTISEQLTLNTGSATTDTTANLLPANSIIWAVVTRTTTAITTAVNFDVGDPTTATRFATDSTAVALNATATHRTHMGTGVASATTGLFQAADAKVRIVCNATPGAGVLRITVFFSLLTPPTS